MEEPIRFDVWAKIIPAQRKDALAAIRAQKVYLYESELRKALDNALRTGKPVRVAKSLSFSAVESFIRDSKWLAEPMLCQESFLPSEASGFCEKHNLHFGGCLGCHVCSGFYVQ